MQVIGCIAECTRRKRWNDRKRASQNEGATQPVRFPINPIVFSQTVWRKRFAAALRLMNGVNYDAQLSPEA